jgi:hypothetical protein
MFKLRRHQARSSSTVMLLISAVRSNCRARRTEDGDEDKKDGGDHAVFVSGRGHSCFQRDLDL